MTINCFINILETLNLTRTIGVTIYCYKINFIVTSKSRALKKQLIVMDQLWHVVRLPEIAVCSSMSSKVKPRPKYLSDPRSNSSTEDDFLPFHVCPHQRLNLLSDLI